MHQTYPHSLFLWGKSDKSCKRHVPNPKRGRIPASSLPVSLKLVNKCMHYRVDRPQEDGICPGKSSFRALAYGGSREKAPSVEGNIFANVLFWQIGYAWACQFAWQQIRQGTFFYTSLFTGRSLGTIRVPSLGAALRGDPKTGMRES